MAIDLDAVARALAAVVTAAELTLNDKRITASDTVGDSTVPPLFLVGDWTMSPHQTHGTLNTAVFSCYLLTARSDEAEGQRTARQAASMAGANSIPAVIEAARGGPGEMGLDGLVNDLVVQPQVTGPGPHELAGVSFFGVKFQVFVVG